MDKPAAVLFLIQAINDTDALVRVTSIYALGTLNAKDGLSTLLALERKVRNPRVKAACWGALLLITEEDAWLRKLISFLNHKAQYVSNQVINNYLPTAIDRDIISADQVVPFVVSALNKEQRPDVIDDMQRFLASHPE